MLQVREAERRADLLTLAAAVGDPALVTPHRALLLQKDFGVRTNRRTSFARRASLGGGPAAKGRLWLCASWPRRRPPSPTTPPDWCPGLRPSQGRKGSPLTTTRCTDLVLLGKPKGAARAAFSLYCRLPIGSAALSRVLQPEEPVAEPEASARESRRGSVGGGGGAAGGAAGGAWWRAAVRKSTTRCVLGPLLGSAAPLEPGVPLVGVGVRVRVRVANPTPNPNPNHGPNPKPKP